MSDEDSAKFSQKLHSQNTQSSSHAEFKSAQVPDLSGSTSGDQNSGN